MIFAYNESAIAGVLNSDLDAVQEASCNDFMEGTLEALVENEKNWNSLMEATGINELKWYIENGTEMPYNEAAGQSYYESAKTWFKKVWAKIQSLFKRFFAVFNKMVMKDKDFAKKYQKDLIQVNTKDFEYKGFKFSLNAVSVDAASTSVSADTTFGTDYSYSDWLETQMGKVVGSSSMTRKEFAKELFAKLRSGEETKETLEGNDVKPSVLIKYLNGSAEAKKNAEKAYNKLKKETENSIKTTERLQKTTINTATGSNGTDDDTAAVQTQSKQIEQLKGKLEILQLVNGACLNAYRACSAQTKSMCVKLLGYKPKKEDAGTDPYTESGYATPNFI